MAERFTREEAAKLPDFRSTGDAYVYFRDRWGKDFSFHSSEVIDGLECLVFHLILDRPAYTKGMRDLRSGTLLVNMRELTESYQVFKVIEGGRLIIQY